jgi:hypothetical protein
VITEASRTLLVGGVRKMDYLLGMINDLGTDTSCDDQRLPMLETNSLAVNMELSILMLSKFQMRRE